MSAPSISTLAEENAQVRILIVDEEDEVRLLCRDIAASLGMSVEIAKTTQAAFDAVARHNFDLVVTDFRAPQDGGTELTKHIRTTQTDASIIILARQGTIESAVEAIHSGILDYIAKPLTARAFEQKLRKAASVAEFNRERAFRGPASIPSTQKLLGRTTQINRVREQISRASKGDYPVLILGETGTGKEMVAQAIHSSGPRSRCPFVPIDCATLTPSLIESELFGHEKGAFTDAIRGKAGLFEAAQTGTVFLDEIGELPRHLQSKLLRVLQQGEVRRIGSTLQKKLNVRIIAATNRDLTTEVEAGNFRADLFYRLSVVNIDLPPLRERTADLPLLVGAFLEKFGSKERQITYISPGVWPKLSGHHWPGNIRELENVIERAMALGSGPVLEDDQVVVRHGNPAIAPTIRFDDVLSLDALGKRTILRALGETNGDKLSAAHLLGIGKTTLYRKLHEYHFREVLAPRN
jgi:DNA-binding NtrC family response regulator